MAGYVYGVRAEGVVVLVLPEIGDDEVEVDGGCCRREIANGVDDGGMGRWPKGYLTWYLIIS